MTVGSKRKTLNEFCLNREGICSFMIIKEAGTNDVTDVIQELFPYMEMSRREREEPDEHQQAQTYWTERGTQRISLS